MKTLILTLLALCACAPAFALTGADLSTRMILDGYSTDFTADEATLTDSLGNVLEYADDSFWGENNDVRQIHCTWDNQYLYLAVDATCWGNNVILFVDIYPDYGLTDMNELNTWKRAFKFYNLDPDFFIATWDTNTDPQFWKMREGSATHADELTGEDAASFDSGNQDRALEARIPWSTLYYNNARTMQAFPNIRLLAVITSGSDNLSGPDVAPDNIGGMAQNADQTIILDNYVQLPVDADGDGNPDLDISPNSRISFYRTPPITAIALKILSVKFPAGKVFAPSRDENLEIVMRSNRFYESLPAGVEGFFSVEIFSLKGNSVGKADFIGSMGQDYRFRWDGRNKNGKTVPFGVYVLRFLADTGEVSRNEAVAVIK